MKRMLVAVTVTVIAGCTTAPQADVMDFVFRSRNACAEPQPAVLVPTTGAVVMQPETAVQQPAHGCCHACGGKKKDCALCRPFQIFRRNQQ